MTAICVTCFAIVDCSFFLIFFTCLYSLKWFCRNDRKLVFRLRAIDEKNRIVCQLLGALPPNPYRGSAPGPRWVTSVPETPWFYTVNLQELLLLLPSFLCAIYFVHKRTI